MELPSRAGPPPCAQSLNDRWRRIARGIGVYLAVTSLVLRFVRSAGVARQQMKWMAFAAVLLALMIPAGTLGAPRWARAIPSAFVLGAGTAS